MRDWISKSNVDHKGGRWWMTISSLYVIVHACTHMNTHTVSIGPCYFRELDGGSVSLPFQGWRNGPCHLPHGPTSLDIYIHFTAPSLTWSFPWPSLKMTLWLHRAPSGHSRALCSAQNLSPNRTCQGPFVREMTVLRVKKQKVNILGIHFSPWQGRLGSTPVSTPPPLTPYLP